MFDSCVDDLFQFNVPLLFILYRVAFRVGKKNYRVSEIEQSGRDIMIRI